VLGQLGQYRCVAGFGSPRARDDGGRSCGVSEE
jgi:hypothetical protein